MRAGTPDALEQAQELAQQILERSVSSIISDSAAFDVFDVLAWLRLREIPPHIMPGQKPIEDGILTPMSFVALSLLPRGSRVSTETDCVSPELTWATINQLHQTCQELHRMSTVYWELKKYHLHDDYHLDIASIHRFSRQETSIEEIYFVEDIIAGHLFDLEEMNDVFKFVYGVSYAELIRIRNAIGDCYMEGWLEYSSQSDFNNGVVAASVLGTFPSGLPLGELGSLVSFTPEAVAGRCGVDVERVICALDVLSVDFNSSLNPCDLVDGYMCGRNLFSTAVLLRDESGNYCVVQTLDSYRIRMTIENVLYDNAIDHKYLNKLKKRYEERRRLVSEGATNELIGDILGQPGVENLKFYGPIFKHGQYLEPIESYGKERAISDTKESHLEIDGYLSVEDVAILVEVKGRRLRVYPDDIRKFDGEIKKAVGEGARQLETLTRLIETNNGLWVRKGKSIHWVDLIQVSEIVPIVITLDDYGAANLAINAFGADNQWGVVPYVCSLHDLVVMAEIFDHPAEFLAYVRQRRQVTHLAPAADELDLLDAFLDGTLIDYTNQEPPQDIVLDVTHRLYAYMYWAHGILNTPYAPKPALQVPAEISRIIAFLTESKKPGWFWFSAELLSLTRRHQEAIATAIQQSVDRTQADQLPHDFSFTTDHQESRLVTAITCPEGWDQTRIQTILSFILMTKHSELNPRGTLSLILDQSGEIRHADLVIPALSVTEDGHRTFYWPKWHGNADEQEPTAS